MKTKIFILTMLCSLLGMNLSAQYFYRYYGDAGTDVALSCGANTSAMGPGHLMAGISGTRLLVTRTDVAGNPVFNNYYSINNAAGAAMTLTSVQITEANATSIVLIGTWRDGGSEGFFFLRLSNAGALQVLTCYRWTLATVTNLTVRGMFNSAGARFYVAGACQYTSGGISPTLPVGAAFDLAGACNWARIYSTPGNTIVMQGEDVELYAPNNSLYMVGSYRTAATAVGDAFVIRLDPANGNSFNGARYGTTASEDTYTGITTCNSANIGGVTGLMISGTTNARAGNQDCWGVKINAAFTVLRSNVYDYTSGPNRDNSSSDVLERRHPTTGVFTYFFTGSVRGGVFGASDVQVVKTDDLLAGVGDYTYGTAGIDEFGVIAGQDNNLAVAGQAGLAVYATVFQTAANRDFLLVKTYFNGQTQCNRSLNIATTFQGPGILADLAATPVNSVGAINCSLAGPSGAGNVLVCTAAAVAGGSNAKTAEGSDESIADFNMEIKAVSGVSNLSAITVSATESVKATVEVSSITGQLLYRGEMDLSLTGTQLPNTGELPAGVIVVKVTAENAVMASRKILLQ